MLGACVAVLLVCAAGAFGYLAERVPAEYNDHLLDGVQGLGGPKR